MTTRCHATIMVGLITIAGCKPDIATLPVGTRVEVSELRSWSDDLRDFVVQQLDAHHDARAYFALDLLKTQPYAELQLGSPTGVEQLHDLRPLVDPLLLIGDSHRGIQRVKRPNRPPRDTGPSQAYWSHVALFERRIAALNKQTPGLPYAYAARKVNGVSSVEETALMISPDAAFLSFAVHGERAFGFLVAHGKLVVRPLARSSEALRAIVGQLLDKISQPPTEPLLSWMTPAEELYDAVLGPFASELNEPGLRALLVSPDDFLAKVPFAVLLEPSARGRRPVVERLRIAYFSSISAYRQLVERPILDEPPRVLAVANPSGVAELPFAGREARTVSELFPESALLVGNDATEGRIAALASHYNVLHFATHGLLLGDIAPWASSLVVAADATHDGLLNAGEIAELDLSHSYLAVLSACDTAVIDAGAANLGSLANAFLVAGTPSVVGSLWQIEDQSTTLFMLAFYRRFLALGAAEALREAMLEVRANPRFAHPFYWAAFVLYGWDK